jgi:hypothetical protein
VHFDHGVVKYNTQDGLDALHIGGKGSSMTATRILAFGNMGQQIKVGGATATITDSHIVGNCRAMSHAIPGTPLGYNAHLGLFCRAGDTAILIDVPDAQPAVFQRNVLYSDNLVGLEIEYPREPSTSASIRYDDNIFIGFKNSRGEYPSPIFSSTDLKMFTNRGSSFSHNITYRPKSNWKCPATWLHEIDGSCSDPHLKDETWHPYDYGDDSRTPETEKSFVKRGTNASEARSNVTIAKESIGAAACMAALVGGIRYLRKGPNKV